MRLCFKILRIVGSVLCSFGFLWFMMPILKGGFGIGVIFGAGVCAFGLLLLLSFKRICKRGGWKKIALLTATACYILGVGWCAYLSVLMNSVQSSAPKNTNVMVLGSQVYSMERMGVSLSNRVDKAFEYLSENPKSACIVTGGQGSNEPCTEAAAEKSALLRMGIEEKRIFVEDKSSDTRENMNFARSVAEKNLLGKEFVIVTQKFHMYRASMLAKSAGLTPYYLVADTDPVLFPLYYGRELLSLTKWKIEELFQ